MDSLVQSGLRIPYLPAWLRAVATAWAGALPWLGAAGTAAAAALGHLPGNCIWLVLATALVAGTAGCCCGLGWGLLLGASVPPGAGRVALAAASAAVSSASAAASAAPAAEEEERFGRQEPVLRLRRPAHLPPLAYAAGAGR